MFTEVFMGSLLLLPLVYSKIGVLRADGDGPEWNYDNTNWGENYTTCNGYRQSPINLKRSLFDFPQFLPIPPIEFQNYDVALTSPLTITNTGKTAQIVIPSTINGNRPSISGGIMDSIYELQSLHFHWGSMGIKGSEHAVNNVRYDAEIHLVHKNINYNTMEEAEQRKDGLAVIGAFFKIADVPDDLYPALYEIFGTLPDIVPAQTSAEISDEITAGQLLGDTQTKNFFTYSGSLTTPPCYESVTWTVFPEPLPVPMNLIQNFWNLRDDNNNYLINNYRPLQNRNGRPVFYRASSI